MKKQNQVDFSEYAIIDHFYIKLHDSSKFTAEIIITIQQPSGQKDISIDNKKNVFNKWIKVELKDFGLIGQIVFPGNIAIDHMLIVYNL